MDEKPRILTVAIWTAAIACGFWTLGVLFNPVSGLLCSLVFLAAAIGLAKGSRWAGHGCALFLGANAVGLIAAGIQEGGLRLVEISVIAVLIGGFAFLLFRAGDAAPNPSPTFAPAWIGLAVLATVFWVMFRPFSQPTGSMEKTLLIGDTILVRTLSVSKPSRGDLVVFHYPVDRQQTFLKRVAGVPGDRIRIERKELYLNGQRMVEPYKWNSTEYFDSYRDFFPSEPNVQLFPQGQEMLAKHVVDGELVVPPGRYFVLGDNRDSSLDSRYWGFISESDIIGRPVMVVSSAEVPTDRFVGEAKPTVVLTRMRWDRFFKPL
ncbi:MAG: signal peptidase I [Bryobacteraceae bacterium]